MRLSDFDRQWAQEYLYPEKRTRGSDRFASSCKSSSGGAKIRRKTGQAVSCWATAVEIACALARLVRTREISSSDWAKARQLAMALADEWSVIQPTNGLRANAAKLADRYDLRARDALQLAAALEWCERIPQGLVFWSPIKSCARWLCSADLTGKRM